MRTCAYMCMHKLMVFTRWILLYVCNRTFLLHTITMQLFILSSLDQYYLTFMYIVYMCNKQGYIVCWTWKRQKHDIA